MYLIILVILITELITVSNGEDNYCMSDCIGQRQPSLYEQHCCNLGNIGNTIKFEDGKIRQKSFVPPTYQRLVSSSTSLPVQIYMKLTQILNQDLTISY